MPSVRDAATMSKSKTKLLSTKAGVALSASALAKLHRLADWMQQELEGNQDPRVRLSYLGRVSVIFGEASGNITHASPLGILIQMHHPFKLVDTYQLRYNMWCVTSCQMSERVCSILETDHAGYLKMVQYLGGKPHFPDVVTALRDLP